MAGSDAPWTQDDLVQFTQLLQAAAPVFLRLTESNAALARPREGMLAFADGTNWNPGSGQGIYAYYGAAWVKL